MSAVKSADRVCLILALLASRKEGLKHAEIAGALRIPSSSASSLLSTLAARGFISPDLLTKRYKLGPEVLRLAGNYLESLDIVEVSRPVIKQLAAATGESTSLSVRHGWEIMTLCKEDSHQLIKRTLQIGERSPMHSTASGKVILAHMPTQELRRFISSVKLRPITGRTITNPAVLEKHLSEIRSKGVAYNREEMSEEIVAIAAPIIDMYGNVNAALVVSFPISRTSFKKEKSIEKMIRGASGEVSRILGFKAEPFRKGFLKCGSVAK